MEIQSAPRSKTLMEIKITPIACVFAECGCSAASVQQLLLLLFCLFRIVAALV